MHSTTVVAFEATRAHIAGMPETVTACIEMPELVIPLTVSPARRHFSQPVTARLTRARGTRHDPPVTTPSPAPSRSPFPSPERAFPDPSCPEAGLPGFALPRPVLPGPGDRQRPVTVRPEDRRSPGPQLRDRSRRRMSIWVVLAARDQGKPGRDPAQEYRILVGRAVVGDLENVHGWERRRRGGSQQGTLRGWFEVTHEQQGEARGADQQGDARVVRAVRVRGGSRRRPQHLPCEAGPSAAAPPRRPGSS